MPTIKILAEPLLHFAVVGVVLFSAYSRLNGSQPISGAEPVRIGMGEVQWLRETYSSQWLRPPEPSELQGLVNDLVNEELFAREAQAMGLGENDTIVRRRLAQKLKFVIEDTSRLADPTDAELGQFYSANPALFEDSPRLSFSHIYFSPENRRDAAKDAGLVLAGLSSKVTADVAELGDRFLLGADMTDADRQTIASAFGDEFADALLAIEPGKWSGPMKSGYGTHLVFVSARKAAGMPTFDAVRDKVLSNWRRENEQKVSQGYLARLREKYGVEFEDGVEVQLEPQPTADVSMR